MKEYEKESVEIPDEKPAPKVDEPEENNNDTDDDDEFSWWGCGVIVVILGLLVWAVVPFNPSKTKHEAKIYDSIVENTVGGTLGALADNLTDEEKAEALEAFAKVDYKNFYIFSVCYIQLPGSKKEELASIGALGFVYARDIELKIFNIPVSF